jgi:hypothetical protein
MTTSKTPSSYCKNCKYFKNDSPLLLNYGKCQLSKSVTPNFIDPITGHQIPETNKYGYASIYRKYECIDAKFYEYEPNLFKRLLNQHKGTMTWSFYLGVYFSIIILAVSITFNYLPTETITQRIPMSL